MVRREDGQGVGGVERLRIGVVDRSPSVRETIAIVLREHDVVRFAPEAFSKLPSPFDGHLLIVERGAVAADALARLAGGIPVIWLQAEHERESPETALPRLFEPHALRRRVREVFARSQLVSDQTFLSSFERPLYPPELEGVLRAALRTRLPTIIYGEAGVGKLRLARAMHRASNNAFFHRVSAATCDRALLDLLKAHTSQGGVTLCVAGLESRTPITEAVLLEMVDTFVGVVPQVWVISLSRLSPEELAESAPGSSTFLHRFGVFTVPLPPLRERTDDLPAIIAAESQRLSELLRVSPASFTPEAWERLKHYLWFGNLTELETVLARTMVLVSHRPITADDILFDPPNTFAATSPLPSPHGLVTTGAATDASPAAWQLEVLLNELAHELKNPLVTIKTISQHLERLLNDETGREQVAQLAGEAVSRMDQLLENLLRFARFGPPRLQPTSVNAVLAPALAELAPLISEKQIVLHYVPSEGKAILGDPVQLSFALENMLRSIVRDLEEGTTLAVQSSTTGTGIEVQYPRARVEVAERLQHYADGQPPEDSVVEPLGFLIARSLLRRNGAQLEERIEGANRCVTLTFAPTTEMTESYAETTRSHRG
ncbi:Phenol regulator MopR [bacterium HR30]|nr:Phenol regulator MopR [bacterium HR30]